MEFNHQPSGPDIGTFSLTLATVGTPVQGASTTTYPVTGTADLKLIFSNGGATNVSAHVTF